MTVESDIRTALTAYHVTRIVLVEYLKPTPNSVGKYTVEVHVLLADIAAAATATAAIQAMSGYKIVRARVVDSWPAGTSLIENRIEIDIIA